MTDAPEYRTQVKRWFVEIGVCDGGGIGHWIQTVESVEVAGEAEANTLRDSWLASGKLQQMPWGELRPQNPYGLFRIRQVWEDARPAHAAVVAERDALAARVAVLEGALREIDAIDPEVGHIGACSENAIRGLVLRMGQLARAALTA